MSAYPYIYAWGNNPMRASLRGRRCRVLVRSRRFNSCLVEFEDGRLVVISRHALRRSSAADAGDWRRRVHFTTVGVQSP